MWRHNFFSTFLTQTQTMCCPSIPGKVESMYNTESISGIPQQLVSSGRTPSVLGVSLLGELLHWTTVSLLYYRISWARPEKKPAKHKEP